MAINFGTAEDYYYQLLNGNMSSATLQTNLGTAVNFNSFTSIIENRDKFRKLRRNQTSFFAIRNGKLASNASIYRQALFFATTYTTALIPSTLTSIVRTGTISSSGTPRPLADLMRGYIYIKAGNHGGEMDRLNLLTDSVYAVGTTFKAEDRCGYMHNSWCGYMAGGETSGGSSSNEVNVFYFGSETETEFVNELSNNNEDNLTDGNEDYGWTLGGSNAGTELTNIDKFTFSTESAAATGTVLSTAIRAMGGGTNDSFLYSFGGTDNVSADVTTVQTVDYSDDSLTTVSVTGDTLTAKGGITCARQYDSFSLGSSDVGANDDELYSYDTSDDSQTLETATLAKFDTNMKACEGF